MTQVTNTEEAHTMKAKVTRTKIAVAAGIAVLAAGLATPLAGVIITGKNGGTPNGPGVIVEKKGATLLAGAIVPNKKGCSGSTSSCAALDL